jgi:L-seryl-tRNA(Ser) seleniumtransferase
MNELRNLPSVEQWLQSEAGLQWQRQYGRPLTLKAVRSVLDEIRSQYRQAGASTPPLHSLEIAVTDRLKAWTAPSLLPVINATGVILHTNLGRAPLSPAAIQAIEAAAVGYSNLEFDLTKGQRGSRLIHAEAQFKRLTGAEAALVVNNNAAAVLLALTALARRRAVVIARSQLVEIGGGFRVPDVMKQSGARLVEVGTTNRVHLSDYTQAISEEKAALVMRAHRSNFQIIGFTSEPDFNELVNEAHRLGVPIIDDLGSGSFLDTEQFGLGHEPTVYESLQSGADLVCFSGDKLLGGPQAGIILGKADLMNRIKKHPLARAVRADKLCLAALSATLNYYLRDEATDQIPVWRMISASAQEIHRRAQAWSLSLGFGEILPGKSTIGGGSLPGETLPTSNLALTIASPNRFAEILRASTPPIIVRVEEGRVLLDPRTVLIEQEQVLLQTIRSAWSSHPSFTRS